MKLMKYLVYVMGLLFFWGFSGGLWALNVKERYFVEQYHVVRSQQKILDSLFTSLDKKIKAVLDGENSVPSKEIFQKILEMHNFKVHALRCSIDPAGGSRVLSMVLTHPHLPLHFIKIGCDPTWNRQNLTRLIVADRINRVIEDDVFEVELVDKVEKWLYRRPGRPDDLNDLNYLILARKVEGVAYTEAPLYERSYAERVNGDASVIINALQPKNATHVTFSLNKDNILITARGTVAFIDTELQTDRSFIEEVLDLTLAAINKKERAFLENHRLAPDAAARLEKIFAALPQKLENFLSGDVGINDERELKDLLINSGFVPLRLKLGESLIVTHDYMPNYVFKMGLNKQYPQKTISRVAVADFINRMIDHEHFGLTTIDRIEKKLWQRPGRSDELLDTNYVVLAPLISGMPEASVMSLLSQKKINDYATVFYYVYRKSFTLFDNPQQELHQFFIKPDGKIGLVDLLIKSDKLRSFMLNDALGWDFRPPVNLFDPQLLKVV